MTAGRVVVMGAAGSGKSTVAAELAKRWGTLLVDADELHPAANVEKLAAGIPLEDDDRWPWLATTCRVMRAEPHLVVACSAPPQAVPRCAAPGRRRPLRPSRCGQRRAATAAR